MFCLYGADFIIDDTLKVWLTEVQIRPALALTGVKRKFLPRMIKEMLHIALGTVSHADPISTLETSIGPFRAYNSLLLSG